MAHEAGLAQSPWGGAPPSPGNTSYLHGNLVGTTERMTDANSAIVRRAVYTAFGEPVYEDGTANTRYGYAGARGYQEAGTGDPLADLGWIHVGYRYYDPSAGRFVQRDPIGIEGGSNVYLYVDGIPTALIDPYGEMPEWLARGILCGTNWIFPRGSGQDEKDFADRWGKRSMYTGAALSSPFLIQNIGVPVASAAARRLAPWYIGLRLSTGKPPTGPVSPTDGPLPVRPVSDPLPPSSTGRPPLGPGPGPGRPYGGGGVIPGA